MYHPDRHTFVQMASRMKVVPVWFDVMADTETPVSLFLKLCGDEFSYLLESVEGSEHVARYSFIGLTPFLLLKSKGASVDLFRAEPGTPGLNEHVHFEGNPFDLIASMLAEYCNEFSVPGPRFSGGLVGYIGYDAVRFIERLPGGPMDDLDIPDIMLMAAEKVIVFDHVTRQVKIIFNVLVDENPLQGYERAIDGINGILSRMSKPVEDKNPPLESNCVKSFDHHVSLHTNLSGASGIPDLAQENAISNMSKHDFEKAVRRALEYIRKGDIFQVVVSQRLTVPFCDDPFSVYRVLRAVNPSPYMFYLNFGDLKIAGASPEMLVRLEGDTVESRPIAGTKRRGKTPAEDEELEKHLIDDEKERAEHAMLVDLCRNDLGRVCRYGTVHVPALMKVERFSHVMHLVSEVRGNLAPGADALGVLRACFPAGTLSGAPKVRAMEIIDELEPTRRFN